MPSLPIVCDLARLTPPQKAREQELLAKFRARLRVEPERVKPSDQGVQVSIDPSDLAEIGEFLALERLCCPFLDFTLTVPARDGVVTLHISGPEGSGEFLRSTFG